MWATMCSSLFLSPESCVCSLEKSLHQLHHLIALQVLLKSDHALSHAVSLGTERLWISQVNYTLGITISMLSSMTFYFIGYLLVPVFLEMENRNREVNGRIKVCICYLLYSYPKHWVLGSMILLADVTQFEVLFQQCQKFWCCVSHLKGDLSCSSVNIVGRLSQTCSLLCSPQGKKG